MNSRLQQFLSAENLSQSQLADRLGVAKASISHIIAGRNKPGFDFIETLAHQFPELNLEWLITGSGKMYKNQHSPAPIPTTKPSEPIFQPQGGSQSDEGNLFYTPDFPSTVRETPTIDRKQLEIESVSTRKDTNNKPLNTHQLKDITARNIAKIIVFFDDNTFQELK